MFAVTSPTNHVLRVCSRCLYLLTWPSGTVSVNASMNECLQGQIVGELKGQISRSRGCRISLPTNNPLPRVIFWRTKEVCRHLFGSSYSCYGTNADSLPRRYLVVEPLTAIDHHNARGPILCSMSQTMMVTYPRSSASRVLAQTFIAWPVSMYATTAVNGPSWSTELTAISRAA